jgi:hypothetical protein
VQAQLQDTQSSLASHIDKIRSLETILAEQDVLKQEMRVLHDLVKAQLVAERDNDTNRKPLSNFEDDEDGEEDDAKSVMTVTTDNLERIDQEDEERMEHRDITEEIPEHDLETDEEKHPIREELGRPKTPEPTISINMHAQSSLLSPSSHKDLPNSPNTNSIEIKEQVKTAVKSALEAHHVTAQATIQALEKKVESLEALVKATATVLPPPPPPTIPILVTPPPSIEIAKEKEALTEEEHERLNRTQDEFEAKMHEVVAEKMASLETSVGTVKEMQTSQGQQLSVLQALIIKIQQQAQESGGSASSWFHEHAGGVQVNEEAIKGEEIIEGSTSKNQSRSREQGVGGIDIDTGGEDEGEGGESEVREGTLDRRESSSKGRPESLVSS